MLQSTDSTPAIVMSCSVRGAHLMQSAVFNACCIVQAVTMTPLINAALACLKDKHQGLKLEVIIFITEHKLSSTGGFIADSMYAVPITSEWQSDTVQCCAAHCSCCKAHGVCSCSSSATTPPQCVLSL